MNETRVRDIFRDETRWEDVSGTKKEGTMFSRTKNWRLSMRGNDSRVQNKMERCVQMLLKIYFIRGEKKLAGSNQESSCHNIHKSKIFILKYRIFANANITVQVLSWLTETCGVTMLIFQPKEVDYYIEEGPY